MAVDDIGQVFGEGDDRDARNFAWAESGQVSALGPMDSESGSGQGLSGTDTGDDGKFGGFDGFWEDAAEGTKDGGVGGEFEERATIGDAGDSALEWGGSGEGKAEGGGEETFEGNEGGVSEAFFDGGFEGAK